MKIAPSDGLDFGPTRMHGGIKGSSPASTKDPCVHGDDETGDVAEGRRDFTAAPLPPLLPSGLQDARNGVQAINVNFTSHHKGLGDKAKQQLIQKSHQQTAQSTPTIISVHAEDKFGEGRLHGLPVCHVVVEGVGGVGEAVLYAGAPRVYLHIGRVGQV